MSIDKIPVEQPPIGTDRNLASWLVRFLNSVNIALTNYATQEWVNTRLTSKQDALGFVSTAPMTWATLNSSYPAASNSAKFAFIMLAGVPQIVYSNGSRWLPVGGRYALPACNALMIVAPTFTGTTNGAITLSKALGNSSPRAFVYFAANTVNASQPAGWYPALFTSTTQATVYNDVYIPADGVHPTWPASPTAFSGAVPGGAGTTATITAFTFTLPGGLLGPSGMIEGSCMMESNNSATNKVVGAALGGVNVANQQASTNSNVSGHFRLSNMLNESAQRGPNLLHSALTSTVGITRTVNTADDQTFNLTLHHSAAATDWVSVYGFFPYGDVRL